MKQEEFNRRCGEVFDLNEGEECYSICRHYTKQGEVDKIVIAMRDKDFIYFTYEPDMSERPQALAYLFGERSDFND